MTTFLPEDDARAALDAVPGLTWSPFERGDVAALNAFFSVVRDHDDDPERWSESGLAEYWDAERSRPHEDVLLARDGDDQVVACAWSGLNRAVSTARRAHLGGGVHPDHRGQGWGRAILAWQMAHAAAWDRATRESGSGPLTMTLYAPETQTDVRDLAERAGLPVVRYFHEMTRRLGSEASREVEAPPGIRLMDFDAARSDEVRQVRNAAFASHWGSTQLSPQLWAETVESSNFRPAWTVLAVDETSGDVVGFAIGTAYEQDWEPQGYTEGYTDTLGVLDSHRGRGIASALLAEQARRYSTDGMEAAGLGVDTANGSGALRLYESLGYRATATRCAHQLRLDDGAPA